MAGWYLAHPDPPDVPDPGFAVACGLLTVFLLTMAWRPRLRLFADRVEVRGIILRRVIPLQEVISVRRSRDGLDIEWDDGRITTAPMVGEVGIAGEVLGLNKRAKRMSAAILAQRDALTQDGRSDATMDDEPGADRV